METWLGEMGDIIYYTSYILKYNSKYGIKIRWFQTEIQAK